MMNRPESMSYKLQCDYCDDRDPLRRHPIEYVKRGETDLWWQSPSLAEGLQYHAVTITMDFKQVPIYIEFDTHIQLLRFKIAVLSAVNKC